MIRGIGKSGRAVPPVNPVRHDPDAARRPREETRAAGGEPPDKNGGDDDRRRDMEPGEIWEILKIFIIVAIIIILFRLFS